MLVSETEITPGELSRCSCELSRCIFHSSGIQCERSKVGGAKRSDNRSKIGRQ